MALTKFDENKRLYIIHYEDSMSYFLGVVGTAGFPVYNKPPGKKREYLGNLFVTEDPISLLFVNDPFFDEDGDGQVLFGFKDDKSFIGYIKRTDFYDLFQYNVVQKCY